MTGAFRTKIKFTLLALILGAFGAGFAANIANAQSKPVDKFFAAIETGNVDQVAALLRSGIGVNTLNARGYPPLAFLFSMTPYRGKSSDRYKIAELLISNGADATARLPKYLNPSDLPVFVWAINSGGDENIVGLFLKHGADPNMDNGSPFFSAVQKNNINVVRLMMSKGANANVRDKFGQTPIFFAGNAGVAKLLVDAGADVNARDQDGKTALFVIEDVGVAKLLIDAGADVNAKDKDGKSVLTMQLDPPGRCGTRICDPLNKKLIAYLKSRGAKESK